MGQHDSIEESAWGLSCLDFFPCSQKLPGNLLLRGVLRGLCGSLSEGTAGRRVLQGGGSWDSLSSLSVILGVLSDVLFQRYARILSRIVALHERGA